MNTPTTTVITSAAAHPPSIRHLPVNLFASAMGLAGLGLAWRAAAAVYGIGLLPGDLIGFTAIVVFLVLAVAYAIKAAAHPDAVRAEFAHPVMGNFFGTIAIAVLLLSAILRPRFPQLSQAVWVTGVLVTVSLTFAVVSKLLRGGLDGSHAVPALLIPGVATLDITVTGTTLPLAWAREMNLFAVGVGGVLALLLLGLVINRLTHREALPKGMTPSLMILIAPFEVGFLAYTSFIGRVDDFAALLFFAGLFLFAVLAPKVFRRDIPFSPAWWAISFPIAALVNAAIRYAGHARGWALDAIAWTLLICLTVALFVLLLRTLRLAANGRLLST
jgi:tellurite resistance protein